MAGLIEKKGTLKCKRKSQEKCISGGFNGRGGGNLKIFVNQIESKRECGKEKKERYKSQVPGGPNRSYRGLGAPKSFKE